MKIRLYIEICTTCNLKCKYCFEERYSEAVLSAQRIENFFDRVRDIIEDVVITGGEPTLHPEFDRIVRYIASYTSVIVTTNGTITDVTRLERLLNILPELRVQISLDAYNKKMVDFFCGDGTYGVVINTINQLSIFSSRLSISTTLLNQSLDDLKKLCQFAEKHGISCYFPGLLPYGALLKNWDILMPTLQEYIKLEEMILDLQSRDEEGKITSNKIDTILGRFFAYTDEYIVLKVDSAGNILSCPATEHSYVCSRIENIDKIENSNCLIELLDKYSPCCSAHKIDEECDICPVEKYCQRVFCGNCIHMISENMEAIKYICKTYKYHYLNLQKAYVEYREEEKGQINEKVKTD